MPYVPNDGRPEPENDTEARDTGNRFADNRYKLLLTKANKRLLVEWLKERKPETRAICCPCPVPLMQDLDVAATLLRCSRRTIILAAIRHFIKAVKKDVKKQLRTKGVMKKGKQTL